MNMTHYMQLLTTPLNLFLFMAIPVVLAETVAITELRVLFTRSFTGPTRTINRWAGIIGGIYFIGVFIYLMMTAVVPLTATGGWRGWIDVLAVGAYLAGIVPLAGIALLDLGLIARTVDEMGRMKMHATLVGVFLVVAHVAMIAGMLDPTLGGWQAPAGVSHVMSDGTVMHSQPMEGMMHGQAMGGHTTH